MPLEPSSLQLDAPVLLPGGTIHIYYRIVKVGLLLFLYRVIGKYNHKNAWTAPLFFFDSCARVSLEQKALGLGGGVCVGGVE